MDSDCNTLTALADKLQECLACTAYNNGLAVNIELKITRLQILANEIRDLDMQMEHLQSMKNIKLNEVDEFERTVNDLKAQLLNNDCGSV